MGADYPAIGVNFARRNTAAYPVAFITAQGVPADMGTHRRDLEISAIAALQAWFADPANAVQPGLGRLRIV